MKKSEFVKAIAEKTGFTQSDIREVLKAVQDVTYEGIQNDDEIKIINGVTLTRVLREPRTITSPLVGGTMDVPAKYIPKCKFGRAMKEAVI